MPLIKRKPVTMVPPPRGLSNGTLPADTPVFLLKATGEIFVNYADYADRMTFYLQKTFVCEYSGKSGLDYFEALDHEYEESQKTQEKFPDVIKPKVLRACQYQVEGRQDKLGDAAYDRFHDRFFLGEKVIVHNIPNSFNESQAQYYGIITEVQPPLRVVNLAMAALKIRVSEAGRDPLSLPKQYGVGDATNGFWPHRRNVEVDAFAHCIGSRIEIDKAEADRQDPPSQYIYTVRLMENTRFQGTEVRVFSTSLTRDRQTWNKNLIRRYIKESMARDPAVGSPWLVKHKLARLYKIPMEQPEEMRRKSAVVRDELLRKRAKGFVSKRESDGDLLLPKAKRMKSESSPSFGIDTMPGMPQMKIDTAVSTIPLRKHTKYPMEDLDLDARTILDGRILRSKHSELPPLPVRPLPQKSLPVPQEHFERVLLCYNLLNSFGDALHLSAFTLDDFVNALMHSTLEPRCVLLGEIHSVLSCNIAAENFRVPGTTTANMENMPQLLASYVDEDGMSVEEREKWVRKALDYSRGWDRKARPRAADGRKGWEWHLCGVLTQRGGLETMATLPTVFRHIFTAEAGSGDEDEQSEEGSADETKVSKRDTSVDDITKKEEVDTANTETNDVHPVKKEDEPQIKDEHEDDTKINAPTNGKSLDRRTWREVKNPPTEERYLTLDLSLKLDVLIGLCEMNLLTKAFRTYLDECETRLTDERKERADINRERKELLAEKAALNSAKKPKQDANGAVGISLPANGAQASEPASAAATPLLNAARAVDDDMTSLSIAPSEREESADIMPSSRQPSSSPLPDLEDKEEGNDDSGTKDGMDLDEDDELQAGRQSSAVADQEVASDVDELESSADEAPIPPVREVKKSTPRGKKAVAPKAPVDRRVELEEELELNAQKEDLFDRDWRRFREVARIRPLGYDRFYQRYWWFDGVGSRHLIALDGSITYQTGRLYVQGPSKEDWARACTDVGSGEMGLVIRRQREEGHAVGLGVDEWGYYETEEELEELLLWLNNKGNRENMLQKALIKWKDYIVGGFKKRQSDLSQSEDPANGGLPSTRRTRGTKGGTSSEQPPALHYLGYENTLAQR